MGPPLDLWATHYHTPVVSPASETVSAAIPLLDRGGRPISPPLSIRDWCEAALQGSVSVRETDQATAYVFVDARGPEQANCDSWLGDLSSGIKTATRRARFMAVAHPLGCGVRNIPLAPFRTIAVDPSFIPLESVLFVPALRGRAFQINGADLAHDGYLFAGDRGGAIKGDHIDVFHGDTPATPFPDLFASTSDTRFTAHLVTDDHPAAQRLMLAHDSACAEPPAVR